MAKRFSDTEKWKKLWFRRLSPIHKCFWEYLRDNCNNAGIWEVDFELASFQIGAEIKPDEIERVFKKQFIKINDSKWFLVDFIEWQYNCSLEELNPKNNAHLSAIRELEKFKIKEIIRGLPKGCARASSAPLELELDKNKVKNLDKDTRVEEKPIKPKSTRFVKPKKTELDAYCKKMNYGVNTDRFLSHYNSNGWKVGKNPMKSWEAALKTWHLKNLEDKGGKFTESTRKLLGHRYKCPNCEIEKTYRDLKGENEFDSYRCKENSCQDIQLINGQMVGPNLKYIKPIYKDIS